MYMYMYEEMRKRDLVRGRADCWWKGLKRMGIGKRKGADKKIRDSGKGIVFAEGGNW